jgi:hypothetical protein
MKKNGAKIELFDNIKGTFASKPAPDSTSAKSSVKQDNKPTDKKGKAAEGKT